MERFWSSHIHLHYKYVKGLLIVIRTRCTFYISGLPCVVLIWPVLDPKRQPLITLTSNYISRCQRISHCLAFCYFDQKILAIFYIAPRGQGLFQFWIFIFPQVMPFSNKNTMCLGPSHGHQVGTKMPAFRDTFSSIVVGGRVNRLPF
jgi:hypothetical protein